MKPQDLRIGNYVRLKKSDKIYQVAMITNRKIGFHYGNDKTLMYYRKYCEIEPVLIREVYDKLPYLEALEWNDSIDSSNLYEYNFVPIKYLHQLQNIHYALTGNEIEIEI